MHPYQLPFSCISALFTLLNASLLPNLQADIPVWRGNHNGTYDVPSAPTDWVGETLFEIPLDTKSNGTPILVGNRLIFTAEPDQLICANRWTGEILWQRSNDLYTLHNIGAEKKRNSNHSELKLRRLLRIRKN